MPPKKLQKIVSRRSSDLGQSTGVSGRQIAIISCGLLLVGTTVHTLQLVSVKSLLLVDDLTYDVAVAREEENATLESWAETDLIGKFHKQQNHSTVNHSNLLPSSAWLQSNSSTVPVPGDDIRNNNRPIRQDNSSQIHDNNSIHLNATHAHHQLYYNTSYNDPLWSTNNTISTEKLPSWLTEYMEWHHQQRRLLNESNWQNQDSFRFLIPVARKGKKCGGMTDRIRPLPSFVRLAAQTKRILFIYWERPFALEEFLLPPMGGLDWRVPEFMVEKIRAAKHLGTQWDRIEKGSRDQNIKIFTTSYQSWHYGDLWYKEQLQEGEPPLEAIFRDIWRMLFTPSPPVAKRFHFHFDQMGLVRGEFATAHIRALYAIDDRPPEQTVNLARNAMNCASNLRPGGPFFVASDSTLAIQSAIAYGSEHNVTVVAVQHSRQPLHVGLTGEEDHSLTPEDFYDGFVDLYLMSFTRCTAVGPGGFARWGNWLGFNDTCGIHHSGRKSRSCDWMDAESIGDPAPGYASEEYRLERQQNVQREIPRFPVPIS